MPDKLPGDIHERESCMMIGLAYGFLSRECFLHCFLMFKNRYFVVFWNRFKTCKNPNENPDLPGLLKSDEKNAKTKSLRVLLNGCA